MTSINLLQHFPNWFEAFKKIEGVTPSIFKRYYQSNLATSIEQVNYATLADNLDMLISFNSRCLQNEHL